MAKNFKQKIEKLIVQNLKDINEANILEQDKKGQAIVEINRYYTENLSQILSS